MPLLDVNTLRTYWSASYLSANAFVLLNLLGALLLGMLVGYERAFRGRAAGARTYGLVCMTSAGLTVLVGLPSYWYGGHATVTGGDPTRVIQGIITGIGFLGAGVIMRDGLHVSGLTTAASIWTASAIGILVGVGFYGAAIMLTLMSVLSMEWVRRLEQWLPARSTLRVELTFEAGQVPEQGTLYAVFEKQGCTVASETLCLSQVNGQRTWHFNVLGSAASTPELACALSHLDGLLGFNLTSNK
jgi:putative Mg2+ transporter-C (MgtC) family protein